MGHYAENQPEKELLAIRYKAVEGFSAAEIEAARKVPAEVCDRIETRLKDHSHLVGDTQSLADIALAAAICPAQLARV